MREGWTHTELGAHIDLLTGYPFTSSEYSEDGQGIRLLRGDNVIQGSIRWDDARRWPEDRIDGLERYQLEVDDIVVALDRTWIKAGLKAATIQHADLPCMLVQRVARLRGAAALDQGYLAAIIQSHRFIEMVKSSKTETAVPHISPNDIREFVIELPPLPEQRKIAEILHPWDTAIQKAEQLIAAKELHRDALIQRLYALSNSRGKASRFYDFLYESMETGSSGRHAKKITVKLYGKGVLAKEEKRQGSEQTQYFVRRAGQLIYSKLDFLNGAFGIIPPELNGYESTLDLPAFDISPAINPIWLLGYLTRPTYYSRQVGLARGQRKARRVHPSDLLASSIHVPPRDFQDRIAEILASSQCGIDKSKHLLESLKTQKRGLMQKLLTGEWRVSSDHSEATAQAKPTAKISTRRKGNA